jgi:transient receptor potential cation channel subfamily C
MKEPQNLTSKIILLLASFMLLQTEYSQGKNPWYPRERWDPYDPMLLSEGAFAAGMIFRSVNEEHIHLP